MSQYCKTVGKIKWNNQQQQLSVSMDLKRNYHSNIQPPTQIKGNHIINPLVHIANASTPVRTRIIKPGSQLNSTPVNVHKIGIPAKSPALSNKQNDQGNSKMPTLKPKISQQNINLSPIMALNRKMSEGPKLQQRCYTPTGFKRQQSMQNIHEAHPNLITKNEQYFTQNMQDSRSSNSFRNMLQSRSKTPTRIAFAETLQRQNNQANNSGLLRTSGSAASLLQGISTNKLKDSRNSKLSESRSFEQLINLGTPLVKQSDVLCSNSNDHEKKAKAKYKVIEEPDDQQILVYCSKCAINLVQKGFKVVDLTPEDINRIKLNQHKSHPYVQEKQQCEYYEYADQTSRKIRIKLNELVNQKQSIVSAYQKELDDVDCYYNSLISIIEQQKTKDRQCILKNRQKEKQLGQTLQKNLTGALSKLSFMMRGGHVGPNQLNHIQQMESLLTQKGYGYRFDGSKCLIDKIQHKFDTFSHQLIHLLKNEGRLRIEGQQREDYYAPTQYFSNKQPRQKADCALRFSFEKNLKDNKKNQFGFRAGAMNALEEAPEALEGEDSNQMENPKQKKAFRTLFPEDDQQQQKQGIHSPTFKQI